MQPSKVGWTAVFFLYVTEMIFIVNIFFENMLQVG